jgi:hypothetical protein
MKVSNSGLGVVDVPLFFFMYFLCSSSPFHKYYAMTHRVEQVMVKDGAMSSLLLFQCFPQLDLKFN